jgi:hypothetical protein
MEVVEVEWKCRHFQEVQPDNLPLPQHFSAEGGGVGGKS